MPRQPMTFNMPVEFVTLEHGGQGLVVGPSDGPLITLALYGELTEERKQKIIKRVIDLIHACMPEHTKLEASISALMAADDTSIAKTFLEKP